MFKKAEFAKWLCKLGIEKDAPLNLIPLPKTKEWAKITGSSVHLGRHIDEYVKTVEKSLREIRDRNLVGTITDDAARAEIAQLQMSLREGLGNGTIALSREHFDLLSRGEAIGILGGLFVLVQGDEAIAAMERKPPLLK